MTSWNLLTSPTASTAFTTGASTASFGSDEDAPTIPAPCHTRGSTASCLTDVTDLTDDAKQWTFMPLDKKDTVRYKADLMRSDSRASVLWIKDQKERMVQSRGDRSGIRDPRIFSFTTTKGQKTTGANGGTLVWSEVRGWVTHGTTWSRGRRLLISGLLLVLIVFLNAIAAVSYFLNDLFT
jgi:hypothetical protein